MALSSSSSSNTMDSVITFYEQLLQATQTVTAGLDDKAKNVAMQIVTQAMKLLTARMQCEHELPDIGGEVQQKLENCDLLLKQHAQAKADKMFGEKIDQLYQNHLLALEDTLAALRDQLRTVHEAQTQLSFRQVDRTHYNVMLKDIDSIRQQCAQVLEELEALNACTQELENEATTKQQSRVEQTKVTLFNEFRRRKKVFFTISKEFICMKSKYVKQIEREIMLNQEMQNEVAIFAPEANTLGEKQQILQARKESNEADAQKFSEQQTRVKVMAEEVLQMCPDEASAVKRKRESEEEDDQKMLLEAFSTPQQRSRRSSSSWLPGMSLVPV
eukprot:TRINITY_DN46737_c0_g1_i1.p2 TRINITY_DN46737_c0_g1~~TRINITY_DN46737_c0_g1_i1.p2  ORF type:complete len:330 (+),score=65.16 TRINITY_DN46737_c0_g1_i1:35-1024(+)